MRIFLILLLDSRWWQGGHLRLSLFIQGRGMKESQHRLAKRWYRHRQKFMNKSGIKSEKRWTETTGIKRAEHWSCFITANRNGLWVGHARTRVVCFNEFSSRKWNINIHMVLINCYLWAGALVLCFSSCCCLQDVVRVCSPPPTGSGLLSFPDPSGRTM